MPHKHKRSGKSDKDFNLPPTTVAKPLSVSKSATTKPNQTSKHAPDQQTANKKRKRSKASGADDTPKAFARLMAFQQGVKPKSGLDDGSKPSSAKKRKKTTTTTATNETQTPAEKAKDAAPVVELPRLMPGERMADFSARVDAALPITGLVAKNNVKLEGVKRPRTRIEKKITRMQDEWRERERRNKEKAHEAAEDEEIEAILNGAEGARASRILMSDEQLSGSKKKGKRKGKGKKKTGGDDSDEDPWAAVGKARKEAEGDRAGKGLVGVHDVVQAPPEFKVKLKERLKVRKGV